MSPVRLPAISGDAGIRDLLATMREPAYLRLSGKVFGASAAAGIVARRVPQIAVPVALMAGIYIGLEMAAWLEEEAASSRPAMIDATPAPATRRPAIEVLEDLEAGGEALEPLEEPQAAAAAPEAPVAPEAPWWAEAAHAAAERALEAEEEPLEAVLE